MKVILLADVERVGKQGDVLNVRDGFARNFLLPNKKAITATPAQLRSLDDMRKQLGARQARHAKVLADKVAALEAVTLKAELRVGAEGKAFGSITNAEIAELLAAQSFPVHKHDILLEEPIKEPGVHDISVRLGPDAKAVVKLWVSAQESTPPSTATEAAS
jgi:large subunit ribosomal protein L9